MFEGAMTALITPFLENGEVDYEGFRANVKHQIEQGINGLLVLGTTGEAPTLNEEEKEKLIKITVEEGKGKVSIVVGTGTNNTAKTIKDSRKAEQLGADALLIVTPYYNKPTNEGLYQHFKMVAESVKIPVIVYNIGGRTGKNIDTPTLKRIAQLENVVAVKEASGSVAQMNEVIEQIPNITVLSGDDGLTLPLLALGGKGVISVISNVIPGQVAELVKHGLNGDFQKARDLHHNLIMPLTNIAFIETNPIPVKHMCCLVGRAGKGYRMPMCEMTAASREKVEAVMKQLGLTK